MYEKQIAEGAKWLDENHSGWELKLDLGKLRMSNCSDCVLGQATMNYLGIVSRMEWGGGGRDWAEKHGFDNANLRWEWRTVPEMNREEEDYWEHEAKEEQIGGFLYEKLGDEWGAFVKDRLNEGVSL